MHFLQDHQIHNIGKGMVITDQGFCVRSVKDTEAGHGCEEERPGQHFESDSNK